jgi:hypothetical protein
MLMYRPDYLLFRNGVEKVQAEGYFDAGWRLPAGAAQKLRGTGVVTPARER